MKLYQSIVIFLTITCNINGIAQNAQSPNQGEPFKSTQVLSNGDVLFKIHAPDAKNVSLGGDIVSYGQNLKSVKDDEGTWSITVPDVKKGTYRYNFVVDGVNVYDPGASSASETSALVDVLPNGESEFFAMRKNVLHGAVSEIYYYSSTTKKTRRAHVWTPAGYNLGKEKLPVLYLVHGIGDSDMAWPNVGRAGFIMDNLISEGKAKRMIVVMPDGRTDNNDVKLFSEDMRIDLIPYIEANYNVFTNAAHRAIAGLSWGGMETLETLLDGPDLFSYINIMSSGWFFDDEQMIAEKEKKLNEAALKLSNTIKYLIFTEGGPEDIAYNNCHMTQTLFEKYGIKADQSGMPGGHSWLVWRNNLFNFAPKLF